MINPFSYYKATTSLTQIFSVQTFTKKKRNCYPILPTYMQQAQPLDHSVFGPIKNCLVEL